MGIIKTKKGTKSFVRLLSEQFLFAYWKYNLLMTRSLRMSLGLSCLDFLKGRKLHFRDPVGVFVSVLSLSTTHAHFFLSLSHHQFGFRTSLQINKT